MSNTNTSKPPTRTFRVCLRKQKPTTTFEGTKEKFSENVSVNSQKTDIDTNDKKSNECENLPRSPKFQSLLSNNSNSPTVQSESLTSKVNIQDKSSSLIEPKFHYDNSNMISYECEIKREREIIQSNPDLYKKFMNLNLKQQKEKVIRSFSANDSVVEVLNDPDSNMEPTFVRDINFEILKMPNSVQKINSTKTYSSELEQSQDKSTSSKKRYQTRSQVVSTGKKNLQRKVKSVLPDYTDRKHDSLVGCRNGLKPTNLNAYLDSVVDDSSDSPLLDILDSSNKQTKSNNVSKQIVVAPRVVKDECLVSKPELIKQKLPLKSLKHLEVKKINPICNSENLPLRKPSETSSSSVIKKGKLDEIPDDRTGNQKPANCTNSSKKSTSSSEAKKIIIKGVEYMLLTQIGSGGSAKVYQAFDPITRKMYAIKVVNLSRNDPSITIGFKNEIKLLFTLQDCKRVVKIFSYEFRSSCSQLLIVMEKGDNDLSQVIRGFNDDGSKLSPHLIRFYWQEMLKGVDEIHKRGIVHLDLKPANFIMVSGMLKLIDFGIANAIKSDKTSVFKDCIIGTVDFMSPESFSRQPQNDGKSMVKYNQKSDIWSMGVILYNLVYERTPFAHIKDNFRKSLAIIQEEINFSPIDDLLLLDVIKLCLQKNPTKRPTASDLLVHPYLTSHTTENRSRSPSLGRKRISTSLESINDRAHFVSCENNSIPTEILSQLSAMTPNSLQKFSKIIQKMSSNKYK